MKSPQVFGFGQVVAVVLGVIVVTALIVGAIRVEAQRTREAMSTAADSIVVNAVDDAIKAAKDGGLELIDDFRKAAGKVPKEAREVPSDSSEALEASSETSELEESQNAEVTSTILRSKTDAT